MRWGSTTCIQRPTAYANELRTSEKIPQEKPCEKVRKLAFALLSLPLPTESGS